MLNNLINNIPPFINDLIFILNNNGFEGYLVGGCLRDILLNIKTFDYDIITNAKTDDIKRLFSHFNLDLKGEKYGVVEFDYSNYKCQIATFRTECDYVDYRHPLSLNFNVSLIDDLKRRDYTINALVFNGKVGLVDEFNGLDDLKNKKLTVIGDPITRFKEDPIRLIRGFRFCSSLGFDFDENSKSVLYKTKHLIEKIPNELYKIELIKILSGEFFCDLYFNYFDYFYNYIFNLNEIDLNTLDINKAYLVFNHSKDDFIIRFTLLFCILNEFSCKTDKFYIPLINNVLDRFSFDKKTKRTIKTLFLNYKKPFPNSKSNILDFYLFFKSDCFDYYINIKKSLLYLTNDFNDYNKFKNLMSNINETSFIFKLEDLNINGDDLIEIGFKEGKKISKTLNKLLYDVNFNDVVNNKLSLINRAKIYLK